MPTTTAVFKELKSPVTSLISSYKKGFRSISMFGATDGYELNSTTNFKHTYKDPGSENNTEVTKGVENSCERLENEGSRFYQHETISYSASEDTKIRKTTHIRITR